MRTRGLAARTLLAVAVAASTMTCSGGSDSGPPSAPPPPPPPPPAPGTIATSSSSLTFTGTVGGTAPETQTINITNSGAGTLNWTATASGNWLSVTPSSGTAPSTITVTPSIGGLAMGTHNGTIVITSTGATNTPVTVTARLDLAPQRSIDPGLWTGVTSQGRSINFRVSGSTTVDQLSARIEASLSGGTCTAVFTDATAGVQVAGNAFTDSVSHPLISLSRRIPVSGTFSAFSRVTGTIGGYSGSFLVTCGSSVVFGTGTLWSAMTFEARAMGTVENTTVFTSIMVGEGHACGLTATGAAYCWGWNQFGQLGVGTTTNGPLPAPVSGGLTFARLSGGRTNTCGITTVGATWCWGSGAEGRLGNGTTTNSFVPTQVIGGLTFAQISSGSTHSCALTADGTAYCWGYNFGGQLGDGTTTSRNTPVPVTTALKFTSITAGRDFFTCAIAVGGDAYCWGAFAEATGNTPRLVTGGLKFASLDAGERHACGISTGGVTYCWGINFEGQLGDGTQTRRSTPVPVLGGLTFVSVDAGDEHSCGRTAAGIVHCWGSNAAGALGAGTLQSRSTSPVEVFGGMSFSSLAAGEAFACGMNSRNVVFCWGSNFFGSLGIGAPNSSISEVPQAVHPKTP